MKWGKMSFKWPWLYFIKHSNSSFTVLWYQSNKIYSSSPSKTFIQIFERWKLVSIWNEWRITQIIYENWIAIDWFVTTKSKGLTWMKLSEKKPLLILTDHDNICHLSKIPKFRCTIHNWARESPSIHIFS